MEIFLPPNESPVTYWKYGPTPDKTTSHWYEFKFDGRTGVVIVQNKITSHFVDGLRGDDDLAVTGVIMDQGGPGITIAVPQASAIGQQVFYCVQKAQGMVEQIKRSVHENVTCKFRIVSEQNQLNIRVSDCRLSKKENPSRVQ